MLAGWRTERVNGFLTMSSGAELAGVAWASAMAEPRNPRSAGILFAILPLAGAIGAGLMGEPVIGLLAGLALAALISTLFWLIDRQT